MRREAVVYPRALFLFLIGIVMRITISGLLGAAGLLLALAPLREAGAQALSNDGFQRRHGQMQVLRNGQARPMTRDIHLPTGAIVTKDGFVVSPAGQRTELREGQGCDLRGRPVAVRTAPNGTLALAPAAAERAEHESENSRALTARLVLEGLFGRRDGDDEGYGKQKKYKKNKGKGHGRWKGDDDDD